MSAQPAPASAPEPVPSDDARILVVDDLRSSRMLIGSVLKSAGFSNIDYAGDGIEALERFEAHEPDIILLDIVMPRMDGFEVSHAIRNRFDSDVPILVQSGVQEAEQRVRAFDMGATDLVSKPINAGELISRLRLHIERRRLIARLKRYQKRMDEELHTAEGMQMSLMKEAPEVDAITYPRQARMETFYRPSYKLGGDLWDVFEIDEHRFGVLMVDLSGHGVSAAINAFRLHMLAERSEADAGDPGAWLARLSDELYEILPIEHFATAFYGVFDKRDLSLTFAGAGAPTPVLRRHDGSVEHLDASGLIMGCRSGGQYGNQRIALQPGDRLCLYSDALYENFDTPDGALSVDELSALIVATMEGEVREGFTTDLIQRVFGSMPESFPDDLTILMLEVIQP
ncbi:fused response regulator/phosphatase [Maricaulis sp.]|uniref:PP2C family protein-serine/threonine phosphatase n=1 Tax=Maricaulis sp. TaxID=1486257 RepID=UPI002636777D|nr:fused response regulator/phosphatase [Maricaulis sp.]